MLPEKSRKDTVSAAVFGCRGRYLSQIGGIYSLRDQPIRGQYATSVARGWHASLICHDTSVFTTLSLIDGEGRQPISLGGVAHAAKDSSVGCIGVQNQAAIMGACSAQI
jgi:hypothetical protein